MSHRGEWPLRGPRKRTETEANLYWAQKGVLYLHSIGLMFGTRRCDQNDRRREEPPD